MAARTPGLPITGGELICHADAGSHYTSLRFTEHLALEEIRPSIGSVADAYNNDLMETMNGLYKPECIRNTVFHDGSYKTIADVEYATAGWVDWYNNRRLDSTVGNVRPSSTSKPTTLPSTESRTYTRKTESPGRFTLLSALVAARDRWRQAPLTAPTIDHRPDH